MQKTILKFLTVLAIASPLALAACHNGDEHPGDSASEHPEQSTGSTSEHPSSGGGSEHPN